MSDAEFNYWFNRGITDMANADKLLDAQLKAIDKGVGLTKREHFAAMALQGFCANTYCIQTGLEAELSMLPKLALTLADNLLTELNQSNGTKE